jgi:hypothetical protein
VVYGADDTVAYSAAETVVYAVDDTVAYAVETVYSDEPTGPIPPVHAGDPTDDPTAAIYADTGLPVSPEDNHEHRPSDSSGW